MFKFCLVIGLAAALATEGAFAQTTLLNVSHDPTCKVYKDFNAAFAKS